MHLYEELKKQENKKSFRELVMKYHPDKKGGDEKIMKKLNDAADRGDRAFENFKDELLGKKPRHSNTDNLNREEKEKNKKPNFDFKFMKEFERGFRELQDLEEVVGIRTINSRGIGGAGHPFWIDLKNGMHVQVEYKETDYNPVIDIWLIGKKGEEMEWKVDKKYQSSMKINSAKGAITAIKNLITQYLDSAREVKDPWENAERETFRDSRRNK